MEFSIKADIRRALGLNPDVKLFTNPVGTGWQGGLVLHKDGMAILNSPRRVDYGLIRGSADLIGWRSMTICQEHVGMTFARFLSIEVKDVDKQPTQEQRTWERNVIQAGGLAGIARSVEDAQKLVG